MKNSLVEKLTVPKLVKKLPALLDTRKFIIVFKNIRPIVPNLRQISEIYILPTFPFKTICNIILPPTPISVKLFRLFRFPYQNSVHISLLPILFKCLSPLSSLSFILRLVRRQNSLCMAPPNFVLKSTERTSRGS